METAHLLLSLKLKGISLKCQQLYLSNFVSANTPEAWRPSRATPHLSVAACGERGHRV